MTSSLRGGSKKMILDDSVGVESGTHPKWMIVISDQPLIADCTLMIVNNCGRLWSRLPGPTLVFGMFKFSFNYVRGND